MDQILSEAGVKSGAPVADLGCGTGIRGLRAEHAQRFDLEGLLGRAWSSSYVFRGVQDRKGFDEALEALFDTHARNGVVEFPYRTVGLVFKITTPEP